MQFERRDEAAATKFVEEAIGNNGWPDNVVDESGSNRSACST